jgi:hypothetical protein
LVAIGGASGEVEMHAVLDRLGISDRHEADADGRVLVGPDDDLVLALGKYRPAKCLGPEQGQARQIVSVNDDVVKSYGHVASMRGTLTCISRTRAVTALPGDLICRVADVSVMAMDAPSAWFVVDVMALYRLVGSPEVMAAQMDRLLGIAALPRVTVTVMPPVAHPANASEFIIVDRAAYAEHMISGFTYTEDMSVSALTVRFDRLRGECLRASESLTLIREMQETWTAGVSPLIRAATAGPA